MAKKSTTTTTSKAQREQAKLLEEALKRPGVAEAAATYGRVQAYTPTSSALPVKGGYATGGNVA